MWVSKEEATSQYVLLSSAAGSRIQDNSPATKTQISTSDCIVDDVGFAHLQKSFLCLAEVKSIKTKVNKVQWKHTCWKNHDVDETRTSSVCGGGPEETRTCHISIMFSTFVSHGLNFTHRVNYTCCSAVETFVSSCGVFWFDFVPFLKTDHEIHQGCSATWMKQSKAKRKQEIKPLLCKHLSYHLVLVTCETFSCISVCHDVSSVVIGACSQQTVRQQWMNL